MKRIYLDRTQVRHAHANENNPQNNPAGGGSLLPRLQRQQGVKKDDLDSEIKDRLRD